jgi:lysozyme
MTVTGIDVSKWNGAWEATKSKTAGAAFVFIKSSQATYTDPFFVVNWQKAKDAGLLRGAYHYLDYTKPGAEQANYFLDLLGNDPGELPPTVDFEQQRSDNNGAAARVTLREFTEQMKTRGKLPILYTAPGFWLQYGDTTSYWNQFPLWVAHYTTGGVPRVPAPWTSWLFWQYTSKGDGTPYGTESYNIDMNYYNGSQEQLYAFAGVQPQVDPLDARLRAIEFRLHALEQTLNGGGTPVPAPTPVPVPAPLPAPIPVPTPDPVPAQVFAVCNASSLNVRSGPGVSYPVVATISNGQRVQVLERKDFWSRLAAPTGWCNEKYLQFE